MEFQEFVREELKKIKNSYIELRDVNLYLIRSDGIIVADNCQRGYDESLGALMAGLVNAGLGIIPELGDPVSPRFTIESSESGVWLSVIKNRGSSYFLGALYTKHISPGKIKNRMRLVADIIEENLNSHTIKRENDPNKDKFLFKNITDDEIDKLFSFVGP